MARFTERKYEAAAVIGMITEARNPMFFATKRFTKTNRNTVKWVTSHGLDEYIGQSSQLWLIQRGIDHKTTTAYLPESKESAERPVRILPDIARTLMLGTRNYHKDL